jgi:hypothetical protein
MGTARTRKRPGGGRGLSIHPDQECLPQPLPLAPRLRGAALARWRGRSTRDGAKARGLLSRMLLGAIRGDGRCGNYELGLDAPSYADRLHREGVDAGSARRGCNWRGSDSSGDHGRGWNCPDALANLAKPFSEAGS